MFSVIQNTELKWAFGHTGYIGAVKILFAELLYYKSEQRGQRWAVLFGRWTDGSFAEREREIGQDRNGGGKRRRRRGKRTVKRSILGAAMLGDSSLWPDTNLRQDAICFITVPSSPILYISPHRVFCMCYTFNAQLCLLKYVLHLVDLPLMFLLWYCVTSYFSLSHCAFSNFYSLICLSILSNQLI